MFTRFSSLFSIKKGAIETPEVKFGGETLYFENEEFIDAAFTHPIGMLVFLMQKPDSQKLFRRCGGFLLGYQLRQYPFYA